MCEQQFQKEVMDELKQEVESIYDKGWNDAIQLIIDAIGEIKREIREQS